MLARGRGVGKALGESYLYYAPRLGYRYSVFNLVYANNMASLRIWDGLGFDRIGLVKGAGRLRSAGEGNYVDAVIYGKDLLGLVAEDVKGMVEVKEEGTEERVLV